MSQSFTVSCWPEDDEESGLVLRKWDSVHINHPVVDLATQRHTISIIHSLWDYLLWWHLLQHRKQTVRFLCQWHMFDDSISPYSRTCSYSRIELVCTQLPPHTSENLFDTSKHSSIKCSLHTSYINAQQVEKGFGKQCWKIVWMACKINLSKTEGVIFLSNKFRTWGLLFWTVWYLCRQNLDHFHSVVNHMPWYHRRGILVQTKKAL